MTATKIRTLDASPVKNQAVYRLEPAYKGATLVVASGVVNRWAHEVMLFRSSAEGDVLDWTELFVITETTSHEELFDALGYEIDPPDDQLTRALDEVTRLATSTLIDRFLPGEPYRQKMHDHILRLRAAFRLDEEAGDA